MIGSWQFIQCISQRTWIYNNFSNGATCLTLIVCDIKLFDDWRMRPIIFNKMCHHEITILNHVTWYIMKWMSIRPSIMMSSNGNIFCVTGPLCGEFTGHWWIPLTKASDAELWCFLSVPEQMIVQTNRIPSCSLWRHCNEWLCNHSMYCEPISLFAEMACQTPQYQA